MRINKPKVAPKYMMGAKVMFMSNTPKFVVSLSLLNICRTDFPPKFITPSPNEKAGKSLKTHVNPLV